MSARHRDGDRVHVDVLGVERRPDRVAQHEHVLPREMEGDGMAGGGGGRNGG